MFKINESIIVIQAEAINPIQTNVVFWSHDRGTAKLRMKLVQKDGIPQSLPEGTTVPIRLMFRSATAEDGYGKHDYLATIEDRVNGIVSIVLEDKILGYVGKVEGSVYIDFPDDRSLDTAGRFTFYIKRSSIDDSTPELENYYFNGFSQTIDKIEKILADGKQEIDAKVKDTNDKITKANQKITEYDQNLTELRNDMKLSEAWAWSKDGTDRFTRKYPGENYAKNSRRALELSNVTNNINLLKGDVPYNFADLVGKTVTISVEIEVKNAQPQTSGVDFRIGCEASIPRASGGTFYLGVWEKLSAGQTIATKRISRTLSIPNDIVATQASGLHLYVQANGDYFRVSKPKIEIGDTPTIYTPAPSEDYENAYPQYRGLALLPSDLPNDYSWDVTPEYTEKGLNDTVSLTEPQSVEGLKNFADGIQIAGDKVISENDCTVYTLTKDNSQSFIDGYVTFIKHGKEVIVNGTVKFKKAYAFGVPLDDEVPDEFIARIVHGMLTGQSGTNSVSKAMYVQKDLGTIMTNSEFAANEWFTFHGNYWVGGK
ncbi:TPA: BppU family phage baseplate upper protein [Enterococcus faecium]